MILKAVPNQKGYFVSNEGHLYSQWINKGRHGLVIGESLKPLKGMRNKKGHISVRFGRNGKRMLLHRLIYTVFVGPIPEGMVIRHKNDIPTDNRLSNLELGTQKDNVADCINNGNFKYPPSKLNIEIAKEIRAFKKESGLSNEKIADIYKVSRKTIDSIIKKRTWKEVM